MEKKQISIKSFFQRSPRVDGTPKCDSSGITDLVTILPEKTELEDIGTEEMSYEKIREENIRRNSDFLAQLGLHEFSIPTSVEERRKVSKKRSIRNREESHRPLPKRIQPKRGVKMAIEKEFGVDTKEQEDISDSENEVEDRTFDDSSVLRYAISIDSEVVSGIDTPSQALSQRNCENPVPTLKPLSSLQSDSLLAVYSMHPHPVIPSLLVAAGKGGQVAIYSIPETKVQTPTSYSPHPLLEFRAHTRWISSAKFFSKSKSVDEEAHIRLLTTADDGMLKFWDVAQCNLRSDPKILSSVSLHEKGIFAMDERDGHILTGSKDRSLSVSVIQSSGEIRRVQSFLDLHASVVKGVQWKPSHEEHDCPPQVFVSGGQDCSIFVQDIRSSSPALHIPVAHEGGVHTVSWCPVTPGSDGNEHLLMSAGYDSSVKIFDVRVCGGATCPPLHTFRDQGAPLSRRSSITTPAFLTSKHLLIPNELSSSISVHCTLTGKTLSRGSLEEQPLSVISSRFTTAEGLPRYAVAACKRKGVLIPFHVAYSQSALSH
jgi:WD40 repeat protein